MFAVQRTTQDLESVRTAILLLAVALVIFWRAAIKFVIMILAIAVVILLGSGVFVLLQSMPHATR